MKSLILTSRFIQLKHELTEYVEIPIYTKKNFFNRGIVFTHRENLCVV